MKTETLSFLEQIKMHYTIACGNPEPEGQEADALMTESDKLDKYGPLVKTYKSESSPNKAPYEVRWKKGSSDPTCTCRGWTTKRKCWHTDDVKSKGLKTVATVKKKFKASLEAKYTIIAATEYTYNTSIDLERRGDKIFAFLGGKNVDVSSVFKGLDTSWLTEEEDLSPDVTFTFFVTPGQKGTHWDPEEPAEVVDVSCELTHNSVKLDISDIMEVKLPDGKTYEYHMYDTLFDAASDQEESKRGESWSD